MYNSILDLIGNTPLVKLNFESLGSIFVKLEYYNPTFSIKDRSALYMIEQAEKKGTLLPGGTLIEASSGNQGIATAMIGAIKGYKVVITVPDKVSQEKMAALQAYGAQLVICPTKPTMTDPEGYHAQAMRIHQSTPNSYMLNQYFNLDNQEAHYYGLGPEIWQQTNGKITHFCGAVGSGGTMSGAGRFLKEQNPAMTILAVDSACSYRSTQGNPEPYIIEGMGVDFDAPNLNSTIINEFLTVRDSEMIEMAKNLAHQHGLLVGPPAAAVASAVHRYASRLKKDDLMVVVFTDSGRSYLTRNFYKSAEREECSVHSPAFAKNGSGKEVESL